MDTEQAHKMTAKQPPVLKQVRSTAQWTISVKEQFHLSVVLVKLW